ncbi:MAG: ribosomal protein [Bacteroidota bacterium]|jgi:large subunit ribosomal protein L24
MAKGRFAPKLHIKSGDTVVVTTGTSKGKQGKVLRVFPDKMKALVEGINIVKKHQKPTQTTQGGIIEKEAAIHISNLMHVDPKTGTATRIGRKEVDGKLVRYSKKSGEIIK